MSKAKILSADGLTEIAEQQISESRNLFFESPTAPSLSSISTTPTNVFADDAADDAILWSDGVETPLTMSVAEASSQGTQTAALSLPENVISKKLAEVAEVDSVLNFELGSQTITPESPSVILRNTEGLDGKTTVLPFLKVGAMEVAINGTKLISGVNKEYKKITAANYADGSSFSMNLADNLPNSKLIDIVRAYYESRGAEVDIRKGGGMVINPFANCLTSLTKVLIGKNATLQLKSSDNFIGESYFFSCVASSVAADYVRLTLYKADGTSEVYKRYIEKKRLTGGGSLINCRISFKYAQHQYTQIEVSFEDYSSETAAAQTTFEDVMLSRSDVLTPYTTDPAETEEQLTMLESMDVAVSYPFATAIAGKTVLWQSWKLGGYNTPAKTVTAGYSSGMTDPVLSVTKNSVGGVDTSAINVGINGKATTGHYLDEKGAPLSGLFFSSRKDLQTSAGFLVKWLFAACSRKLTITQPRGGSFGEVMEEQGDNSTNYYMFAPPAQPLNGYTINVPSVPTSRAFVCWRRSSPGFSGFASETMDIKISSSKLLGVNTTIVSLKEVRPAYNMPAFAESKKADAAGWFYYASGTGYNNDPSVSQTYQKYFKKTHVSQIEGGGIRFTANFLGFTRTQFRYSQNHIKVTGGTFPERVTLRRDAPCRVIETWLHVDKSPDQAKIAVHYGDESYYYNSYGNSHALVYIIAFGIYVGNKVTVRAYGNYLRVIALPETYSSADIYYVSNDRSQVTFTPSLFYYQLNEN